MNKKRAPGRSLEECEYSCAMDSSAIIRFTFLYYRKILVAKQPYSKGERYDKV